MNFFSKIVGIFVIAGAIATNAADMVRYTARPGSTVKLDGTSTLHDWTMESHIIGGFFELPAGIVFDESKEALTGATDASIPAHAECSIPVRSLKSTHAGMDEVMQQAMNEKAHPKIQFRLTEMKFKSPHAAATPFAFDAKGELIINGVTNVIAMPVTIANASADKLKVAGKIALKMTDYKVKPPAPDIGLGLITTGDEVKISIEWLVAKAKPADAK